MNKHTFPVFGILQSGFWGRSAKVIGGSGEPAQPSIP